jgi:hypothetical protein
MSQSVVREKCAKCALDIGDSSVSTQSKERDQGSEMCRIRSQRKHRQGIETVQLSATVQETAACWVVAPPNGIGISLVKKFRECFLSLLSESPGDDTVDETSADLVQSGQRGG